MLINIDKFIEIYNALVLSKKFKNIKEDTVHSLYKKLLQKTVQMHETHPFILNLKLFSDFLLNNEHLFTIEPLQIQYNKIPRALSHLPELPKTSKSSVAGKYTLLKQLGKGHFGKVYLAQLTDAPQTPPPKLYAIKRIDLLGRTSSPLLIKKEIETLKKLNDIKPQVSPKFYEAFIQNDYVNIVQEYVKCGTLHEYTKTHKLTPPMKKQIRSLVSILHKHNIFHKDLHSENIFVQCDDNSAPRFLIGDFGQAKTLSNVQNDDYVFIQELKNSNASLEQRLDTVPVNTMLFELILAEIFNSKIEFCSSG